MHLRVTDLPIPDRPMMTVVTPSSMVRLSPSQDLLGAEADVKVLDLDHSSAPEGGGHADEEVEQHEGEEVDDDGFGGRSSQVHGSFAGVKP
jgi:hypothetical protein